MTEDLRRDDLKEKESDRYRVDLEGVGGDPTFQGLQTGDLCLLGKETREGPKVIVSVSTVSLRTDSLRPQPVTPTRSTNTRRDHDSSKLIKYSFSTIYVVIMNRHLPHSRVTDEPVDFT